MGCTEVTASWAVRKLQLDGQRTLGQPRDANSLYSLSAPNSGKRLTFLTWRGEGEARPSAFCNLLSPNHPHLQQIMLVTRSSEILVSNSTALLTFRIHLTTKRRWFEKLLKASLKKAKRRYKPKRGSKSQKGVPTPRKAFQVERIFK